MSPLTRMTTSSEWEVGPKINKRGASTRHSKLQLVSTPSRSSLRKPPKAHRHRRSPPQSPGTTRRSKLARHGYGSGPVTVHSSSRRRVLAPHSIDHEDDGVFARKCLQPGHNVQVIIRARPVSDAEIAQQGRHTRCVRRENAHTVAWIGQPETRFTFDHVADEFVTQKDLFQVAGMPIVDNCMAGYNSCMFAYGQTGSGKTHTMLGDIGDRENRGMTPRVFEHLFAKIQKEEEANRQKKLKYKCRCSFLEIYNEQICDLLEPSSSNLQMREDGMKGVFVEGLLEVEVQTVEDVLHLLLLGATNRKVAATHMNRESSRSHSVFTCVIEKQWECDSMINFRFGRLNLVDLAGSESQKNTGADEKRLREAASINKSLSTLGLVIMVLVDVANGKHRHVPYRDSKLTFLLQGSLGGNSKTTIIANISPSCCASWETLSTLKFAQRAKFIQNSSVVNEKARGDVKGLHDQIQQLKDELAHVRRQSVSKAAPTPTVLNHKQEALVAELAAERLATDQLRDEVEFCRRNLSECQLELQTSLNSNERITSELNALRMELESTRDECRSHKRELEAIQSEQKIAQEKVKRSQLEHQLQEAMQESTNLQTELQWTRDSLEEVELVVENLQQMDPALEIGDPEAAYEASVVGQLQSEIVEMHARLEEERRRGRELETQIHANDTNFHLESLCQSNNNDRKQKTSYSCNENGNGKVRHQDAILQLLLELDSGDKPSVKKETHLRGDEHASLGKTEVWNKSPMSVDFRTSRIAAHETTGAELRVSTLNLVLTAEDQERHVLKALVSCLDADNAYLHQQLLETEADSAGMKSTVAKMDQLRSLVEDLERSRGQLQQKLKRKQAAMETLEKRLLIAQQLKVQCQEMVEENKLQMQAKQVEVDILGKTVEELENTVYALESQVVLLKREGDRQSLLREDVERELQKLRRENAVMHPSASGGGEGRESNVERNLKDTEVQKLEEYQICSDEKASFLQPKKIPMRKVYIKRGTGSAFQFCNETTLSTQSSTLRKGNRTNWNWKGFFTT